jgi:hypothetical protein
MTQKGVKKHENPYVNIAYNCTSKHLIWNVQLAVYCESYFRKVLI